MILGTDPLSAFLRAASGRPFSWGEHDCLMWLADWIEARRGLDPAAEWRGRYRSERGAMRIVAEAGGMVEHVARVVEPHGIMRTKEPKRGDIAVTDTPDGHMGAIVMKGTTAALARGPMPVLIRKVTVAPIIAAWSL